MNASRLRQSRPVIGVATLVAGAAILIGIVLANVVTGPAAKWMFIVSAVAFVVAFAAAGASGGFGDVGRLGFAAGAVGWGVYALTTVLASSPGVITIVSLVIALLGSLTAGIVVYQRKAFGGRSNDAFLIAMILTVLYIFVQLVPLPWLPSAAVLLLTLVWGAVLVISGLFILQRK